MMAYASIISEMSGQQLLRRNSNVQLSIILHGYCAVYTLTLLKRQKDMVSQQCFIPLGINGACNENYRCDPEEETINDKMSLFCQMQ
ncbi:hypothetical protein TNCV_5015981 [Trichonephila clavipes]|nr:hypothetical protein TNCV_5015981 [Trichonephila clavipes]